MAKDNFYTSSNGNNYIIGGSKHSGYSFKQSGDSDYSIVSFDTVGEVEEHIEEQENGGKFAHEDASYVDSSKEYYFDDDRW